MATQVAVNTKAEESIAFARGRRSLDRSVWYSGSLFTFLATGEETHGQFSGSLFTFLATGEETHGQFSLIEVVSRKGNAPPRHIHHREDETFYMLEGEITVSVGDRTFKATPGTMVFLPRDIAHSFVIDSEHLRMLILVAPAGLGKWFKEFSVAAPDMTLPPPAELPYSEIQRMLAATPKYGLEFVMPKP